MNPDWIPLTDKMIAVIPDTVWDDFYSTPNLAKERHSVKNILKHLEEDDRIIFANIDAPQGALAELLGLSVSATCRRVQRLQAKLTAVVRCECKIHLLIWDTALADMMPQRARLLNTYAKYGSKREAANICGWSTTTAHYALSDMVASLKPEIGQLLHYCLEHRVPIRTCLLEDICQQEDQAPIERRIVSES